VDFRFQSCYPATRRLKGLAAGKFQHLAHVGWRLNYSIEFGILNGDLTVRHNLSTFNPDPVALGAPSGATFKGIDEPLARLQPPLANDKSRAALLAAFTPGNSARRDLDGHPPGAPSDFIFSLPPIVLVPPVSTKRLLSSADIGRGHAVTPCCVNQMTLETADVNLEDVSVYAPRNPIKAGLTEKDWSMRAAAVQVIAL